MEISTSKSVAEREEEGVTVHLCDEKNALMYEPPMAAGQRKPSAENKPVTITVVGTYSKTYRRVQSEQRLQNMKGRRTQLTPDDLDQRSNEVIASCVIAWEGFTSEGKPFPYSKENAAALFQAAPWIREQVEEAMGDHAAFFPKP